MKTNLKAPIAGEIKDLVNRHGKRTFSQVFTLPNGELADYTLYGTNKDKIPSIVLPVTKDLQVLAVNQFRFGANEFVLELPGGMPKGDQTAEETMLSELEEETGYRPEKVVLLSPKVWFDPASVRVPYAALLAIGCVWVKPQKLDRSEILDLVKIPLEEWMRMTRAGEICDSKTLATTMLALPHLLQLLVDEWNKCSVGKFNNARTLNGLQNLFGFE